MAWQRERIKISSKYGPAERRAIALEVLEFIRERTAKGKDKKNNKFKSAFKTKGSGYSKEYRESTEFLIAGKTNKINIDLSSETMSEMDLLSHRTGSLLIGYENGTKVNNKAEGNIKGTYGQKRQVTPKRDYLGITKKDLNKILKQFPTRGPDVGAKALELLKAQAAAEAIVADVAIAVEVVDG